VKQIVPGLYAFTGLMMGRVYLIEDPDGLTIIDAGLGSAAAKILQQLTAAGRQAADVKRILITHAHPDHVGGLPALQAATGAAVFASAAERPVIEGKQPVQGPPKERMPAPFRFMPRPATRFKPTPVARTVADGERLDGVMDGLVVLATPGHSPGHVSFWQPQQRIVFCGDVLMRVGGLRLPIAAFTTDMDEDKRSIRTLAALQPRLVCFGHGLPLYRDTAATLQAFAQRQT
jgi:glyoxylase-like metal-dependent hydrolase (beta-lactamase superfamily II)